MDSLSLVPIRRRGVAKKRLGSMPVFFREVSQATVAHYDRTGFDPPFIGYLGMMDSRPVGACGFKSKPKSGAVEIAYGTLPGFEGKGIATSMAWRLIAIARKADPRILVTAQTLPHRSASTSVLKKLGFSKVGDVMHPEDGRVWEWHLAPGKEPNIVRGGRLK